MKLKCANIVKYGFILANIIIFLGGLILLIGGISILCEPELLNLPGNPSETFSVIIITIGVLLIIFSLMGIYSSIKTLRIVLIVYTCVFLFLSLVKLCTAITGTVFLGGPQFESYLTSSLSSYFRFNSTNVVDRDKFQFAFKCCGWLTFMDYFDDAKNRLDAPASCCRIDNCRSNDITGLTYFERSCKSIMYYAFSYLLNAFCYIMITFSILLLINATLSIFMIVQLRKRRNSANDDYKF